jgi:ribonuclease HI
MSSQITIFTDGGSRGNPGPAALGVVVYGADNTEIYAHGERVGTATNNEAEYAALLHSLTWVTEYIKTHPEITRVEWKLDSKLVVEQTLGHWKVKEPRMAEYVSQAKKLLSALASSHTLTHVPRSENARADELVNQALDAA